MQMNHQLLAGWPQYELALICRPGQPVQLVLAQLWQVGLFRGSNWSAARRRIGGIGDSGVHTHAQASTQFCCVSVCWPILRLAL